MPENRTLPILPYSSETVLNPDALFYVKRK